MATINVGNGRTTVTGTIGSDEFRGSDGGFVRGAVTLLGGLGDDVYHISNEVKVVETALGGTDTIVSMSNYVLPSFVENLVLASGAGIGNDLDNRITGSAGGNFINGGRGNDTLTGGNGAPSAVDIFQFDAQSGRDTITDWSAADKIRIGGYTQFQSFAQVKSALTQVGNDVVLKFDASNSVTLLNTKLSSLTASNFQYALDLSQYNMRQSFSDDFNTFDVRTTRGGTGTWSTEQGDWRGSDALESRTLMSNGERQIYVDPGFKGLGDKALGLNPFTLEKGVLTITAQASPEQYDKQLYGYDYTSGYISTRETFAQTYGYFEARLQLPAGTGSWPAFWLVRKDGFWPPEMDVMEAWDDTTAVQTVHTNQTTVHTMASSSTWVPEGDTSFHTYGMLWAPDKVTWFIDGVEVFSRPTPADMHSPMYMILNLAVSGRVDDPNFHEEYKIDYVRSYAFNELPQITVDMGAVADMPYGFNSAYYRAQNPDVAAGGFDPLWHFETYGRAEGRLPYEGATRVAALDLFMGKVNGLIDGFNVDYYTANNPDVVRAGVDPLKHYLQYGKSEGRLPYDSSDVATAAHQVYLGARSDEMYGFNYTYYAMQNPDVVKAGADLFKHYVDYGRAEGRLPFDPTAQPLGEMPDVKDNPAPVTPVVPTVPVPDTVDTTPVTKPPVVTPPATTTPTPTPTPAPTVNWGYSDAKHDGFNVDYYKAKNPDVVASGMDPLWHYQLHGKAEGRLPYEGAPTATAEIKTFDPAYYALHNPDVMKAGMDPKAHYDMYGKAEGRIAFDDGSGAGYIKGTAGADVLVAPTNGQFKVMTGGAGADVFKFAPGTGWDTITDFEVGIDKIDASALFAKYGAPTISSMGWASGSMATFAGGETILMLGLDVHQAQTAILG